jgi:hypothetical protein
MKRLFMLNLVLLIICITVNVSHSADEWAKIYGGNSSNDYANSIQQTTDGGYIVAGSTRSFGAGDRNVWILKLNANGEIPDCNIIRTSNAIVSDTTVGAQDTNTTGQSTSATATDTSIAS